MPCPQVVKPADTLQHQTINDHYLLQHTTIHFEESHWSVTSVINWRRRRKTIAALLANEQ